jgi:hypothetical protein
MPITPDDVKYIAPLVVPFISALIETRLKPKLVKIFKSSDTDSDLLRHSFTNKFEEYLARAYDKHSYLTVLVFQNQQKKLEDLYIPMTVEADKRATGTAIKVDSYKDNFIPKFNRILITDTAGMGKSTLLKFLFLACVRENKGLPVFIDLRKLSASKAILNHITSELTPLDEEPNQDLILALIRKGDFVFFLDGFDEIPLDDRTAVVNDLQDFISRSGKNSFVITSRPESALASFSSFKEFHMRPLNKEEAFTLLRKYDNDSDLSKEIIAKIESEALSNIQEFLTNPLLVSLIYKSYEYKPTIPFKKHIFYRQVYDSLFECHDLTKDGAYVRPKHTKLDIEDFHRILRFLGFATIKLGKIEYEKDEILKHLRLAREHCSGLSFKESDFLIDLLKTVPLFSRDGDYYRWSHKSLQDYFAAQFICVDSKADQEGILLKMAQSDHSDRYYNTLDLCYDIDYKSFRKSIIYKIICDFIAYFESSYKDMADLHISENETKRRKQACFKVRHYFLSTKDLDKVTSVNSSPLKAVQEIINAGSAIKDLRTDIGRSVRLSSFARSSQAIILSVFENSYPLMRLLKTKKDAIVELSPRPLLKHTKSVIPKKTTLISDSTALPFNTKTKFVMVTDLLMGHAGTVLLDIEACRRVKKEIEAEKQRYSGQESLLHGI